MGQCCAFVTSPAGLYPPGAGLANAPLRGTLNPVFGRRPPWSIFKCCSPLRLRLRLGAVAVILETASLWLSAAPGEPVNLAEVALLNLVDGARNVRLGPAGELVEGTSRLVEIEYPRFLQVEWPQRVAVRRLRLNTAGTPGETAALQLGWWEETPAGTSELSGRWVWCQPQITRTPNGWELGFPPLKPDESANPAVQGARFRLTQALRIGSSRPLTLKRIEVFSEAVWQEARIEVRWERPPKEVAFEGWLARVLDCRSPSRECRDLRIEFSAGPDPLGADQGLLLIQAGPTESFAVRVAEVVWQRTIRFRDPAVRLTALEVGGSPISPAPMPADQDRSSIIAETERAGVATQLQRVVTAAAAENWTAPIGFSLPGARQGFQLMPTGEVVVPDPLPGSPAWDQAARPWRHRSLRCLLALGGKRWQTNADDTQSSAAGWMPSAAPVWIETRRADGLEWRIETLVAPLAGAFPDPAAAKGSEALVLGRRFRVSNPGDSAKTSTCWVRFEPAGPLRLTIQDTVILGRPSDGREHPGTLPVRAQWDRGPGGRLDLAVVPVWDRSTGIERMREAVRYRFEVPARGTHEFTVWLPAIELLAPEEVAALQELRYAEVRPRMDGWWAAVLEAAAELSTPDGRITELWRTWLRHGLASLARDPGTGEWHLSPPGALPRVSLGVVGEAARWLGQAGFPTLAAELLLPALRHQGQRAPAGVFRQTTGAFCAQHERDDPFCSVLPANQHPAYLRAAAEFLQTHPQPEPSRWASALTAGAEWLLAERLADGRLPPTPGVTGCFMARSFAFDGEGIAALRALADWLETMAEAAPGDTAPLWRDAARRYRREADSWQTALRRSLEAQAARTPAVSLPDGSWIPDIPWADGHPASALGESVEAVANSPVWLAEQGVLPANHPFVERALWELVELLLYGSRPASTAGGGGSLAAAALPAPLSLQVGPVWLDRGQTALCWRMIADALTQHLDPATQRLECEAGGMSGWGPMEAVAAEIRLAQWILETLVREKPNALELGGGLPPNWPAPGKPLRLSGWRTRFGRLTMSWQTDGRQLTGRVELTAGQRRPQSIRLRLPPAGSKPYREVRLNGRRKRLDPDGWIDLPSRDGVWEIRASR